MTLPEHVLLKRRLPTRDEDRRMKLAIDALEKESDVIDRFIIRLNDVIKDIVRH